MDEQFFAFGACLSSIKAICLLLRKKQRNKRKRLWVRPWVARREQLGIQSHLLKELKSEDPKHYENYLRMDDKTFCFVASKVHRLISRENTHLRNSISVEDRLTATLRFLATGESYSSLQYSTRIPQCTLSLIIPETCEAIYESMKDEFLKRRRSTTDSITNGVSYPGGIMLPNSVVRNQRLETETLTVDDEASGTSSRRGSYWDDELVDSIRKSLRPIERQQDPNDLSNSNKQLFRRNKIKVNNLEPERKFSHSDLTAQELRRLKRAQRRVQAIPVITEIRRATQESLKFAMERSEEMELTDDEIIHDICLDTHHKHKHIDEAHKLSHVESHRHQDKGKKSLTNVKKSHGKINVHLSVHEEKHPSRRALRSKDSKMWHENNKEKDI